MSDDGSEGMMSVAAVHDYLMGALEVELDFEWFHYLIGMK